MENKFKGRHLVIDAFGIEGKNLKNKKSLYKMLESMPQRLGMQILKRPAIKEIKSDKYPNTGLSGFVILYESHMSFHTWPEKIISPSMFFPAKISIKKLLFKTLENF